MAGPYKVIETKSLKGRLAAIGLIIVSLLFAWFSIRLQLGNMLGSLTQPNAPNAAEIASFARDLSPNDPITNWLEATINKDLFSSDGTSRAVAGYADMVRNAPYDHRAWVELARALEQAELFDDAEKAFKRAVELAPAYSYTHWHLANFYLRQGREDEAMDRFRAAASKSPEYRDQVFSIVWEYFEKDPKRLDQLADQRPEVRAGLAKFYAARELPVESLRVWNTLSAEEKQDHHDVAKVIAQALYEKRFFRSAVAYVKQLGLESGAELGVIQNPGFETPFEDPQKVYFGWKSVRLEKTDVRSDQIKKHGGNRSLRIAFSGYNGIEVKNVWQVAAVQSSKRYRVRFWVRTEDLKSAGPPLIEIVNANDNKILATSPAFPTGNNDWTEMKVEFEVPETAEGILVRLDRAYCGDACPIFGSVWLDDFVLEAE